MYHADVDGGALLTLVPGLAVVWLLLEMLDAPPELTAPVRDVRPALLVGAIVVPIAVRLSDRI